MKVNLQYTPGVCDDQYQGAKLMTENQDRLLKSPNLPSAPDDDERPACAAVPDEAAECPQCAERMRLWASFYRCPNCGYKESCCF
jgi:hypothetical protein